MTCWLCRWLYCGMVNQPLIPVHWTVHYPFSDFLCINEYSLMILWINTLNYTWKTHHGTNFMDSSSFSWNDHMALRVVSQYARVGCKRFSRVSLKGIKLTERTWTVFLNAILNLYIHVYIFLIFVYFLYYRAELKFPTSVEDIRSVSNLLKLYKEEHFLYVLVLFCSAYIYKQTFAIPGSVFMASFLMVIKK